MNAELMPNLKKTIIWYSVGTTFYFFSQWMLTIIVAKIAGMNTAGDYALAMSSSNVIYQIALFGMRPYQISDINKKFDDSEFIFSRWITCIAAITFGAIFCLTTSYTVVQKLCILVFMVFRLSEAGMDVLHGIMQSSAHMEYAGKSLMIRGVAEVALFIVAISLTSGLLTTLLIMTLFSILWMFIYEYPISRRLSVNTTRAVSSIRDKLKRQKTLLLTCIPILASNLVYALVVFMPRYYIEGIYGAKLLGVFASISAPALVIPMLASYVYTPFMPMFTKYFIEDKKNLLTKLIVKIGVIILAVALLILVAGQLFGEWGLAILFGDSIKPHAYLLVPIIISVICTACVFFLNSVIISMRKFRLLIISSVLTAVLSLGLSGLFVSTSLNGASIDVIVVQSIQIIVVAIGLIIDLKKNKNIAETRQGG